MNTIDQIVAFLYAAILAGVPLLYGTLGEIITEKAGHLNLGVEGMMYMGAVMGYIAALTLGSPAAAFVLAALGGTLGALVYAFLTVTLKANQNVTGLTLTIFGTGFANFFGARMKAETGGLVSQSAISALLPLDMGALSDLPVVGKLLFSHSILTYIGVAAALLLWYYLKKTRRGLNLRAVGENPAAADAMGVNVTRYKYVHLLLGGALCGIGGMYVSLVTCVGSWQPYIIGGQGWIAVALVIFAAWSPARAVLGSFVFGALSVLRLYVPANIVTVPAAIFSMLPFVVTCIVLVVSSIRMKKENQQPAACGVNYFREER